MPIEVSRRQGGGRGWMTSATLVAIALSTVAFGLLVGSVFAGLFVSRASAAETRPGDGSAVQTEFAWAPKADREDHARIGITHHDVGGHSPFSEDVAPELIDKEQVFWEWATRAFAIEGVGFQAIHMSRVFEYQAGFVRRYGICVQMKTSGPDWEDKKWRKRFFVLTDPEPNEPSWVLRTEDQWSSEWDNQCDHFDKASPNR